MFGFRNCFIKCLIFFTVTCIKSIIACHFEIPFRYVLDQKFDKIYGRYRFTDKDIIFVTIVVKGYVLTIIGIDTSESNHRTTKISADIVKDGFGVTKIGLGVDIEAIFIFFVNESFGFLERRTNALFHFI